MENKNQCQSLCKENSQLMEEQLFMINRMINLIQKNAWNNEIYRVWVCVAKRSFLHCLVICHVMNLYYIKHFVAKQRKNISEKDYNRLIYHKICHINCFSSGVSIVEIIYKAAVLPE